VGTGYTRQSAAEIDDNVVIEAVDIENEFDALQSAFNGTTGHAHDGTSGEGPLISLSTSITGRLPVANGGIGGVHKLNATTAPTINDDTTANYVAGSVWVDVTNDVVYICVDASSGAAIWQRPLVGSKIDQPVTGGFIITPLSGGTVSSGTYTPDPGDRPLHYYTNNGAHTLAPSSNTGKYDLEVTNGASAGTVTLSGWTKVSGSFTTTNGDDFMCHATINQTFSLLEIIALQ
jgi:outer membrane protein assembly factor BamB